MVQKQDFCPSTVLDVGKLLTGLILKARLVVTKPPQQQQWDKTGNRSSD
jgi:hypothetical protein